MKTFDRVQSLSELGLKNLAIEEIRKLQAQVKLELIWNEERDLIKFSTRYWDWYPCHYIESPEADTGDLYLSQEDFAATSFMEGMIAGFQLLEKLVNFVRYYKIKEFEELAVLLAQQS
jgi:hypothetical protein